MRIVDSVLAVIGHETQLTTRLSFNNRTHRHTVFADVNNIPPCLTTADMQHQEESFCSCDLDLDSLILIYELDLKILGQDTQTHRQTDRQTERQTDTQTHRQTDRQTERQTDRHTDRQTDRQTERQTDTQRDRLSLIHI